MQYFRVDLLIHILTELSTILKFQELVGAGIVIYT